MHQEVEYRAYVLIKVQSGKDLEVFEKVKNLQNRYPIEEIATVYGDYDVITKIQITRPQILEEFIFNGLRQIPNITETKTLLTARYVECK